MFVHVCVCMCMCACVCVCVVVVVVVVLIVSIAIGLLCVGRLASAHASHWSHCQFQFPAQTQTQGVPDL